MPIMAGLVDLIASGIFFFATEAESTLWQLWAVPTRHDYVCALACGCDGNSSQLHARRRGPGEAAFLAHSFLPDVFSLLSNISALENKKGDSGCSQGQEVNALCLREGH